MRRTVPFLVVLILLAACGRFSLVEPGRRSIADFYTVEPQIEWSRVSDSGAELWTVDGPVLESIWFFNALHDGDTMFAEVGDENLPSYRPEMKPNEVMEFVLDSLAREWSSLATATGSASR